MNSFLARLFGAETRSRGVVGLDAAAPPDRGAASSGWGARVSASLPSPGLGPAVSADVVLSNLSVAARCVALRSELLASVPLHVYRRTASGGRERADDHPLYATLHDTPNPDMTSFEVREMLVRSLDLYGNGIARIERNNRGQVVGIYPLLWPNVGVERLPSGRLRYRATDARGSSTVLLADEVLHIRGSTRDGMIGLSPIQIARGALSLALSHAETAQSFTENAARPSGAVSFPNALKFKDKDEEDRFYEKISEAYSGSKNAAKMMVLSQGAKFEQFKFSSEDAEFLNSRKLENEDVARIFGLPPTVVGITDKATYSNAEHEGRALVQNAMGPLASRVETAIARCCLTDNGRRTYYVEHDLSGLLRGDVEARFKAYRMGREIGALSPNDVRRRENEPPIPGGDEYHVPANWVPLGTRPASPPAPADSSPSLEGGPAAEL